MSDRPAATPETTTIRQLAELNERARAGTPLADADLEQLAGLMQASAARLREREEMDGRRFAWELLDLIRRPEVLTRIDPAERNVWGERILTLIDASRFTVGPLFRHRAELYGSRALFESWTGGQRQLTSWRDAAAQVESYARQLLALAEADEPPRIALLSENRLELALLDLACLSTGIVNVMVPANATDSDVGYILAHSGAGVAIASGEEQLRKVLENRESLGAPARVITIDPLAARGKPGVESLDSLRSAQAGVSRGSMLERSEAVRPSDLATVMYTSGTTGLPKGIRFSQRNIVFKRFARALALPEIGEDDRLLCYLPLFHTFGRFLELLGSVFWGARYCFLASTSVEGLARGMRRCRPTVFISVPKKWIQLHELITGFADPLDATDDELDRAVRSVTGGSLKWGLSAAGHLDSEVFRFFAEHGVELLSGFGMTEATGGITMTAPGAYRKDSLGGALPGIELRLADDGELLVRGPYVMDGYLDPPDGREALDPEGWLNTGDLMEMDSTGQLQLVDRKKEIYKNLQGETIAPQRVENQFRDFESVGRAFLVGDHREYNTLLIYPNPDYKELDLTSTSSAEVQEHFRSLIVSVNKFLAHYERIVDFALIDRDLDADREELTEKGTPRRKFVQQNFAGVIRDLYRRTRLLVGGVELRIPNWLFQILGLTARDIRSDGERITLLSSGATLTLQARDEAFAQIGSCVYRHDGPALNLGTLLTSPPLWLGNEELVSFVPLDMITRQRSRRPTEGLAWADRVTAYSPLGSDRERLERAIGQSDLDLLDVDLAARMLAAPDESDALAAVDLLETVLRGEEGPLQEPARLILERQVATAHPRVRRRAFQVLVPAFREARFPAFVESFLSRDPGILDQSTRAALCEATLSQKKIAAFLDAILAASEKADAPACGSLLEFVAAYGSSHPISYRRLRAFLERVGLLAHDPAIRELARSASGTLLAGFRTWLGANSRIAVDPETGQEYRWEEVVVFDEQVPEEDRGRLLSALRDTAVLREGIFLFSKNASVGLSDIPPGGVWIRLLGSRHGKSVYRATVQTRYSGAYDLAVNVNHGLSPEEVGEEIRWLILSGDPGNRDALVEDFGGYWPEQDLWSEEFIAGETLYRSMRRLARHADGGEKLRRLWPFFARATLSAFVDFWNRSGRRFEIAQPDMTNIVVPTEDYLTGGRIVSLTRRRPHTGLLAMLRAFRTEFLAPAEEQYPELGGIVSPDVVFQAVLEIVGETVGVKLLREALAAESGSPGDELTDRLGRYVDDVIERGFTPMRLHLAVERYLRWAELNRDPTPQARALTLQELYETYGLQRLVREYPEIRLRFFLETVYREGTEALTEGLWEMVRSMRSGHLAAEGLIDAVDALRDRLAPGEEDEYFLARLSYPYLRPEDAAGFARTQLGGRRQSEIVVTLEDADGRPFRVRHALNPKEVERLLQLFLAAKLDVRFRIEHRHLVALGERGQIIAGIYYEIDEELRSAHLEKIVVAERFRREGVADGLMGEFFNRLRAAGVNTVTTGFFRPEYFYRYGFRIEKRYAGLVKSLTEE